MTVENAAALGILAICAAGIIYGFTSGALYELTLWLRKYRRRKVRAIRLAADIREFEVRTVYRRGHSHK